VSTARRRRAFLAAALVAPSRRTLFSVTLARRYPMRVREIAYMEAITAIRAWEFLAR
jgi:hypothetical protein